jgi:tricarballylate dehydrogenase
VTSSWSAAVTRPFAPRTRPLSTASLSSSLERALKRKLAARQPLHGWCVPCVYDGVDDLRALMPDLTDEEVANSDFGTYTQDKFFDDMGRVTEYRTDPDLCELLITRSKDTMRWMQKKGIRFIPIYGRQAYKIDGKFKFWGGLTVEAWGGGPGLVEAHSRIAGKNGVTIAYKARALSLIPMITAFMVCA